MFLRVSAGVNKPLSVVESYCFSRMNISLWSVSLSFTSKVLQWLHTTVMWYTRRIIRISWTENKNEEVMEMTRYKKILLKTIRKKTTSIFGHIKRADGLEKQILSEEEAEKDNAQNTQTVWLTSQQWAHHDNWRQRGLGGHDHRCLQQSWHRMMRMLAHVFDPMGDEPLFLLILFVFMVIVSLILFISFIKAFHGVQTEKSHLSGASFKLTINMWDKNRVNFIILLKNLKDSRGCGFYPHTPMSTIDGYTMRMWFWWQVGEC